MQDYKMATDHDSIESAEEASLHQRTAEMQFAWQHMDPKKRMLTIAVVLAAGVTIFSLLVFFQEEPPKVEALRVAAPVSVVAVSPSTTRTFVRGFGSVAAYRELAVRPQVSGSVVELAPQFEAGGRLEKGALLFQIDPRDYEIALQEAKAQLERALFELKLEQGNQVVAKREWKLLRKEGGDESSLSGELALRKPHLREKEAQVNAARSRVQKAEIDLERTKITAPFDVVILQESVELGKFVSPQEVVGSIAATDKFEIEVQVPRSELRWIPSLLQNSAEVKLPATVIQRVKDDLVYERKGTAERLLSNVGEVGRMARVRVLVENPLAVDSASELPLLIGTYVEVVVQGIELSDVYPIPQKAMREGGVIWAVDEKSALRTYPVETVFSSTDRLFIRGELPPQLQVITNALPGALEGMPVAIQGGKAP